MLGLEPMHGGAVYVLELSSYQLDLTSSLKPDVAIILNITPDHLDRHGSMDGYVAAKRRILLNQGKGDTALIGIDDAHGQQICTEITAANRRTIWPFSAKKAIGRGVYALGGVLYDATDGPARELVDLKAARSLPGRHNWQNAAAAYAACRALGLSAREAVRGLMSFGGLAHRMETIGRIGKVRFINDSKATNIDAARQAMSSYPKFRWIAGGRAKDGGIACLADLFPRVERAYLIGEAAPDFEATLKARRRRSYRARSRPRCARRSATPAPAARRRSSSSVRRAPRSISTRTSKRAARRSARRCMAWRDKVSEG